MLPKRMLHTPVLNQNSNLYRYETRPAYEYTMADRRAAELGAPWWLQGLGGAALPGARWGEGLVYG